MANEAFSLKSASVRWAGWATVTYGRVGKLKTRVGKRKIFSALRTEFCPPWPETLPAPWLCDICQETEQVYSYNPELAQGVRGGTSYLPALGRKRPGGMSGGNMSRGNVRLPLQQTINVTQVKQAAQSTTVLPRRQLRADNGSVGHGSVLVTR